MTEKILEINQAHVYYATLGGYVKAVDNVSFNINEGEIVGLAGESGCGKSTLIKAIYGFVKYPMKTISGEINLLVNGERLNMLNAKNDELRKVRWRYISYVPQASLHVLNPVTRIKKQFIESIKRDSNFREEEVMEEVREYLKALGLPPDVLDSFPHQLSGGMQQRIIIAMATFLKPRIVLADEPTTALDVVVQRGILQMLRDIQKELKNSLIVVSHDMGVHYQITHKIVIMYAGMIVEIGPTNEVFNNLYHPYTKLLINSLPRIGDREQREGIKGSPPNLLNPPTGCRFNPRCPSKMKICEKEVPEMVEISKNHFVACHLFQKNGKRVKEDAGEWKIT
ncbi:peptide/nickel transport system ATP-binding protein [Caldicoprobacter guelmensis]|uniref:ABC transporter ATP-binding protein n=1 Tax=Caldicoprobacter guelmensis TaxID=1170224 RepID=UPI00195E6C54|nr:ABC transporter ATP-binding protein [Caldicoprobacter guelmensis]MBM7583356.1 peptide/nickel transport system ATP-binding protein [Caldicoprobacter guelmensis]